MTTIKDVARIAQVSTATVSHVINNTRYVSEDLKTRVWLAMEQSGYLPNQVARSLRGVGSRIIGLVASDFGDTYFAEVGSAHSRAAAGMGYSIIYCSSNRDFQKEKQLIDELISKRVDGIINISVGGGDEELKRLLNTGIPVVLVDWQLPGLNVDSVCFDFYQGGYMAAKYLLEKGHIRIACAASPSDRVLVWRDCLQGFQDAIKDYRNQIPNEYIVTCEGFSIQCGKKAFRKLLSLSQPPTAIFFMTDLLAIGGIIAAQETGFKVPDDVSIIGLDDISLSSEIYPPLTTIRKKIDELGELAVKLLVQRIEEGGPPAESINQVIQPELVERASVAPNES